MTPFATTEEIHCYIRLTLKQHKMTHIPVTIKPVLTPKKAAGLYWFSGQKRIELAECTLKSFEYFRFTLLHELAHALDHHERGSLVVNGRVNAHGKNFRKWCKRLGIPSGRFVPQHLI